MADKHRGRNAVRGNEDVADTTKLGSSERECLRAQSERRKAAAPQALATNLNLKAASHATLTAAGIVMLAYAPDSISIKR